MAASNTIHGASGGHGRSPLLGERGRDGRHATPWAVVDQRQVERPDGPFDAFRGLGRGALGSCGPFLGPGGILGIIATPPLVEPTFCAGQLPTDVLDLVFGTVVVDGLVTTWCCGLGPRGFLRELMLQVQECPLFSMFWHT